MKSFLLEPMLIKAKELASMPFPTEKSARKAVSNLRNEAKSLFSIKNVHYVSTVVSTDKIGNFVFFPRFELDDPDPNEEFDQMIHSIKEGIPLSERLGFTEMTERYHDSQKLEVLAVTEALYEDCDLSDSQMASDFLNVFDIIKEDEASLLWFISDLEELGQYVYDGYRFPYHNVRESSTELWDVLDFNFAEYAQWILNTKDIVRETSYGFVAFPYGFPI